MVIYPSQNGKERKDGLNDAPIADYLTCVIPQIVEFRYVAEIMDESAHYCQKFVVSHLPLQCSAIKIDQCIQTARTTCPNATVRIATSLLALTSHLTRILFYQTIRCRPGGETPLHICVII